MGVALPVVWSDTCLLHTAGGEVWIGRPIPGDELPERALAIRDAVVAGGARLVGAVEHQDDALCAVHDEQLLAFLRDAWSAWEASGYPASYGQDRVVPYIFAHPGLLTEGEPMVPVSPAARPGMFAFDTMTPIGPGTWPAARAAADCALTACDLVREGEPVAYACTRPPGHHVTRTAYGGSCYLNNAAIAAAYLCGAGTTRVAIVDIDAHHGNGAEAIFWERDDVLTASVHVDPAAGWFPHFLAAAGGGGAANLNIALAPGTGDAGWLEAVRRAAAEVVSFGAGALVVALGVDAAAGDSESPLQVTGEGFAAAGRFLGELGLPTVVVQEGGYDLAAIGGLVLAALVGIEEGLDRA
jgi:acetoin utilization deacetylase AcuC-like enzyme